ncbi:MAG: ATP-binding cassette domain-containing protein [Candidatus Cloacimonetes bacterium]|nr:ATP-binding cassette domain-containing protein [Candidatus Cloacimonadota bacterium]
MEIRCEKLRAAYEDNIVFDDLSVNFAVKSVNTIIGPSGSGKSTLLRLLAALEDPQAGTIYYDSKPHTELHPYEIRSQVGLIFQKPTIFEGTVYDNLVFGFKIRKKSYSRDEIIKVLQQVDIPVKYLDKTGNELSIGEQQRICIVRSLLLDPEAILLDEPVSALDPQRANKVLKLIRSLKTDFGKTVIMVSHNMNDALSVSDRIFFIWEGTIVYEGSPEGIQESDNSIIKRFMAGEYE